MALIGFDHPVLLLLVPMAVGLALWVTLRRGQRARRVWIAAALRTLIALCVTLGLAGPKLRVPGQQVCRIYVVDASASATAAFAPALGSVRESIGRMKRDDLAGLIVFGAKPAVEIPPTRIGELRFPDAIRSQVDPEATDVAAALRLARGSFPGGPRKQLVLLWDGNATAGDTAAEAMKLAADGIELAVVPLDPGRIVDARIDRVTTPGSARSGQKMPVEVAVAATTSTSVQVVLNCDGKPCEPARWARVDPDAPARLLFAPELEAGWHDLEARIVDPPDDFPANDAAATSVHVGGQAAVLVASSSSQPWLARLLGANPNFAVTTLGAERVLDLAASLARADCLVLDDLPAWKLSAADQGALRGFVEDGGGLLTVGGAEAFGPGGYVGTQLEKLLPVSCDPRRQQAKPVAVAIVLDKSGSMNEDVAGRPKIDYARLGVLRVVEELKPGDLLGLIVFDSSAQTLLPLGQVKDAAAIKQVVGRVFAQGQTNLNPALDAAYNALKDRPAGTSHVLLLSDGLSAEPVDAAAVAGKMRAAKITLSAVATGDNADRPMLRELAQGTGGRFYSVEDIRRLPEVFSSDVRLRSQQLIIEKPLKPSIARPGEMLAGFAELPDLGGYVLTAPKEAAVVHAVVGDERDALLASWSVGLGRVAAFTSMAGGRWDEAWQRWPDRARFWNQLVRWAARPTDSAGLSLELVPSEGTTAIVARLDEKLPGEASELRAEIVPPSGGTVKVALKRTAARRFEGWFDSGAKGVYGMSVTAPEQPQLRAAARLHVGYSAEWRALGLNRASLQQVASAAGGQLVQDLREWGAGGASGWQLYGLGWLLLLAAAVMFLVDLAVT